MKKELIYCGFVCISSWVSVSYNKVVTDLANQQTVLYLQQPEHRGDLSLTDGCVVCVCVCAHACSHFAFVVGMNVAALSVYSSIFLFVCIYTCICVYTVSFSHK